DGALSYDVQVSLDHGFSTILREAIGVESTTWVVEDELPAGSALHWRARATRDDGSSPWSKSSTFVTDPAAVWAEDAAPTPDAFSLTSVFPNPSSGDAQVLFALPDPVSVSIQVFDVLGRRLGVLVDGTLPAGRH